MAIEDLQVSASNADAEQVNTAVTIDIPYGRAYGATYRHGYKFVPGSNIPQNSTINTGTFKFKFTSLSYDDIESDLYGEDGANPAVFTTGASDITNRTQTTAVVVCDYSSGGTDWIEIDVSTILTELSASYEIQAIVILLYVTGVGTARINHFDGTQADAAKLYIDYTAPGAEGAAVPVISGEGIHSLVFGGVTVR
jgi:hypothetical protein